MGDWECLRLLPPDHRDEAFARRSHAQRRRDDPGAELLQPRPMRLRGPPGTPPRGRHPAGAVLLRSFDPAKDKAVPLRGDASKIVRVEDGAWRIENDNQVGNFRVALATITDGIPEDGIIICRAKVKLQPKDKDAWGRWS